MDDEVIRIKRTACCRLCLAPDNECVSIFKTCAADKEPLAQKIQSCVNIKISESERLSSRICHACISYLNSWQSFKNRCYAAQKKQKNWLTAQFHRQLGLDDEAEKSKSAGDGVAAAPATRSPSILSNGSATSGGGMEAYNYYPQYHKKGKSGGDMGIKEEPKDEDDGPVTVNMELDPSQFLAGQDDDEDEEDDDEMEEGEVIQMPNGETGVMNGKSEDDPVILNALGLTNVSHVNPFNYLATDLDESNDENRPKEAVANVASQCRICKMSFSNRANARRHEKNIHGIQTVHPEGNNSNSTSTPNKPQLKSSFAKVKKVHAPEVFDYTKPERYRHLLTESRMAFIRRNARFLYQYQDMTCKCCNKKYFTYKTFMSHMRKKYTTLPRNVCFKCLRKFETKGQFIAHLKKKNCPNLFTLFMADPSIPKDAKTLSSFSNQSGTDRFGPKEILANKVYGCRICSEQFRLKNDFRAHVVNDHPDAQNQKDPITGNCRNCNAQLSDSLERKRHFSNMECLVVIICGTCENQYDSHARFIQHVYATHMKQVKAAASTAAATDEVTEDTTTNLKATKRCPVCNKDYNNYYNLVRHMEVKHPDQMPKTYKCEICQDGFPRQTELKDHVKIVHSALSLATVSNSMAFPCKECEHCYDKIEDLIEHQEGDHDQFSCHQCDYHSVDKNDFQNHLGTHNIAKVFTCSYCKELYSSEEALKYHTMTSHMEMDSDETLFKKITKSGVFKNNLNQGQVELKSEIEIENDDEDDSMNDSKIDDSLLRDSQSFLDSAAYKAEDMQRVRECPICVEKYSVLTDFIQHMKIHVKNDQVLNIDLEPGVKAGAYHSRMRCRVCQKRISSKIGYKKHLLEEHQIEDCEFVRCDLCPGEFSNEKGLKVHMYRTHNICIKEDGEVTIGDLLKPGQFECDICHTVYRNVDQLKTHVSTVHSISYTDYVKDYAVKKDDYMMGDEMMNGGGGGGGGVGAVETEMDSSVNDFMPTEVWFQCRYCDENFNSRQRLTVHMNTHDEHDPTDYTCKDCGNIYQSRKSLWVHRHKKHPRPQTPSPCEICKKVFFDKTELVFHLKTHVAQKIDFMNELMDGETNGMDEDDGDGEGQYDCHVCERKFKDQGKLSKHLRIHEMQNNMFTLGAFTEAGMDDSGGGGSGISIDQYRGDETEFACDICPKKFNMLTALKVHRGWHFRSPDGRQITDPHKTWQPGSLPPSRMNRNKPQRVFHSKPPRCPHCNSTFASSNNLRRHIVEVHKRNDWRQQRDAQTEGTMSINIEKEGECHSCGKTFDSRAEWIDHKISHARTMRPSTTFEWGCEICGKIFTRKERLLQHMVTHLNSNDQNSSQENTNSNSQMDDEEDDDDEMEDGMVIVNPNDVIDDGDDENANHDFAYSNKNNKSKSSATINKKEVKEVKVQKKKVTEEGANEVQSQRTLSCDLCQISFDDANELRRHVTSHFINGVGKIGNEQIKGETPKKVDSSKSVVKSKRVEIEEDDEEEEEEVQPAKKQRVEEVIEEDEDEEEEDDDEEEGEYVEQTVDDVDEDDVGEDQEDVEQLDDEIEEDMIEDNYDMVDDEEEEEGEYVEEYIDEDKILKNDSNENISPIPSPIKCRLCNTVYDNNYKSIKCMESHRKPNSSYACDKCKLYFLSHKQLSGHQQAIHAVIH